jgi:hypothetical protein
VRAFLAWELGEAMRRQNLTKTALAAKLGPSRTEIYRLLDPNNDCGLARDAEADGGRRREAIEGRSSGRGVISEAGNSPIVFELARSDRESQR